MCITCLSVRTYTDGYLYMYLLYFVWADQRVQEFYNYHYCWFEVDSYNCVGWVVRAFVWGIDGAEVGSSG